MRNNKTFNYFEAYGKQTLFAKELTLNLVSAIHEGELGTRNLMKSLHVVENDADQVNHEIQSRLLSDFVVPMDRGGMSVLAHALDDVCDAVEQVAIDAYTRKAELRVEQLPQGMMDLVSYLEKGIESLGSAMSLLESFGKERDKIKRLCVEAQSFESKADDVYVESVRFLYEDGSLTDEQRRVRHDLFDTVEDAMDSVEAVAEALESLIAGSI